MLYFPFFIYITCAFLAELLGITDQIKTIHRLLKYFYICFKMMTQKLFFRFPLAWQSMITTLHIVRL